MGAFENGWMDYFSMADLSRDALLGVCLIGAPSQP